MTCTILTENASETQIKNIHSPSDAMLIYYRSNGTTQIDICRADKMSSVFDYYYDKLGKDSIQKITYGYGKINPRLWNNPEKTKKSSERE